MRAPDVEQEDSRFNRKRARGRDRGDEPLKAQKGNPGGNTSCYVQILGTGMDTQDTSPSVLLFFDKQRFIFNAGEGLQRFCTEHKIKLSRIDYVFLTRACSETAGGFPGLLLTLAGIGEEGMSVNIRGPSGLEHLVNAMRSFISNKAMVHTHSFGAVGDGNRAEISKSETIKPRDPITLVDNEVVRITATLLHPSHADEPAGKMNDANIMNSTCLGSEQTDQLSESIMPNSRSSQWKAMSTLKPVDIAVVYACELGKIIGEFDRVKAEALGLKPGPKYRRLQDGNSVKSDLLDIMVHPSDVLAPSIPGPIVLLVDCPTAAHLSELVSLESLNIYYTDSIDHTEEGPKSVNCIIHLGPASVTTTAQYQGWMRRFSGARHIMAGHEMKNIEVPILRSSARITSWLNYLCPHFFPVPGFCSLQESDCCSLEANSSSEEPSLVACESIPAENLLKFHLRPYSRLGFDRSAVPKMLTVKEVIKELLLEIPEIADTSKIISQFWHSSSEVKHTLPPTDDCTIGESWTDENALLLATSVRKLQRDTFAQIEVEQDSDTPSCLDNVTREDMEIVLLGTGCSMPSKYRNVSSIFVDLFSRGSFLLDCGEGTLAQLKRRFGMKGADDAVKALRFIWISHIHADHHAGLARILAFRCKLLKGVPHDPILVIGPEPLNTFLDAYSKLEDLDMQFLDSRWTEVSSFDVLADSHESGEEGSIMQRCSKGSERPVDTVAMFPRLMKLKQVLHEAGIESLFSIRVMHSVNEAFGVVLKAAERINSAGEVIPGWKLVYSGDTLPCQALRDACQDATVLIHEATFEDGLEEEAESRGHSTTMQAVDVGTSGGAYRIILTHFSQRYPKIPVFDEKQMRKTCIAFDMMSVNLADLPVLPKVLPYTKLLFRNEAILGESEDAAAHHQCGRS